MRYEKIDYSEYNNETGMNLGVVREMVVTGLFPKYDDVDFYDFPNIIIDLDSLLSTVMKLNSDVNNEIKMEYGKIIVNSLGWFINQYQFNGYITIYYNMDEYKTFTEIYPDWNKERQSRYDNFGMGEFIQKTLLKKLKLLEGRMNNFKIKKCNDAPILDIKQDLKTISGKTVILSRDPHYNCLFIYFPDMWIFDGKHLFSRDNFNLVATNPKVKYNLLPYYYIICGMNRNEYKGYRGMGPKKTITYLKDNLSNIIKGEDEIWKEVEKYKDLFFLKNVYSKKQENNI